MILYHGTDTFSAEKILTNGISISVGRPFMDFGQGFYIYGPMADSGVSRMYARYRAKLLTFEEAVHRVRVNTNGWQWVVLSKNAVNHISNIRKVVF